MRGDMVDGIQPDQKFAQALGKAVVHVWAELPQEIQEKLFEHAVVAGHQSERDESLREELAKYLHDHHQRTLAAPTR
jgi:glucose-6-phosphate-specific signal transduction histidine kinase